MSGDIHANGNIAFRAATTYPGGVRARGNIVLSNDSIIQGNMLANGNVNFNQWNARANANVQAGGDITKTAHTLSHHVPNGMARAHDNPHVEEVPAEDCDPLDMAQVARNLKTSLPAASVPIEPNWWPFK